MLFRSRITSAANVAVSTTFNFAGNTGTGTTSTGGTLTIVGQNSGGITTSFTDATDTFGLAVDSTVVMYQVENDSSGQISVLVEACGSNAATIQTRLQSCNNGSTGNIGIAGNIWSGGGVAVSSSNGFKLA